MLIGFAQKVRCERPPAAYAALPLFKGENALIDIAGFTAAVGGRGSLTPYFLCKAMLIG